jgi:hypothetical protein
MRREREAKVPEADVRREIERQAEDHVTLGLLLRQPREESKRRAVDNILAASLNLAQKIERIRAVDAQQTEEGLEQVVRQARSQESLKRIAQLQRSIKLAQQSLSYLSFLFSQYGRFRAFAARTRVLQTSLWPPGVWPSQGLRAFFVGQVQAWAAELSPLLQPAVEHGWLYLTPLQYNLVVLLKRLSDRLLSFDFVHLEYRDRNLIDRLKRVETPFLFLRYRPEHLDALLGALRVLYQKQHRDESECSAVVALAVRLLSPGGSQPSLEECLVGLNMAKHRRTLTLAELLRPELGQVVGTEQFDCPPRIRRRMEAYIQDSLAGLKRLHEQAFEVQRLNSYVPYDDSGGLSTERLRSFYESTGGGKRALEADLENVAIFAARFFRRFDQTFFPLLGGRVQLSGGEAVPVFARSFFETELTRLRGTVDRLEKGPFHFASFPLARYLGIKAARLGPVGNEMEVVQLVDEGLAALVDLGKGLCKVLGLNGVGATEEATEPLQPIILQGKPFRVPCGEGRIQAPAYLRDRTVVEAIADAVSICFTAGILLQDRFLFFYVGREKRLRGELQGQLKLLENLLDPDHFQRLKSLYR